MEGEETKQASSALFFLKASHHLLIRERKSDKTQEDRSSKEENALEVCLDSLEKTTQKQTKILILMNVYGIMYLSLWCSSPQDECMFNTLPYYITDLFIIAYMYSKVSE